MKTLKEQQKEAWRLAPQKATHICQDDDGMWGWRSFKPTPMARFWSQSASSVNTGFLFSASINGWDWRDTLQSREDFEEMQSSELDKTNVDHKEDFVPEVGQSVQCKDSFDISGTVLFVGKKHALLEDDNGEEWAIYIGHLEPVKSEPEKRRDKQIEEIASVIASEDMNTENWKVYLADAQILYNAGCRMTRKLTDDVVEGLWDKYCGGSITPHQLCKSVAAYVTGSGEYE